MKPIILRLSLISNDKTEQEDITLAFEEPELKLLTHYVANCDRLATAQMLQRSFPMVEKIQWTSEAGLEIKITDFQYTHVYELLHLARPIFLSQEPASFEKTQAVFGRKGKNTLLTKYLKSIRKMYEKGDYQPYYQVSLNSIPLFHDRTLNAWLNGAEYHQDSEKAKQVEALKKSLSTSVARGVFVSQLSGRIRATFRLAELSKMVIDHSAKQG
jgi:hypothetical protein